MQKKPQSHNSYFPVPPVIIESLTSNDLVVREGTNVTLQCRAQGFPEPYVMWRREDGNEMSINGENGKNIGKLSSVLIRTDFP